MSEDNTTTEDDVQEVDAAPLSAVIVVRETKPDGSIHAVPMIQGDIDPLGVQTLLELAIQGWRERIGLPPR